jgi:hypothetical protein
VKMSTIATTLAAISGLAWLVAVPLFLGKSANSQEPQGILVDNFTQGVEDRSLFFRFIARYKLNDEQVEFNIVVGCAIRVTSYADGGSSYDAARAPVVYAKATQDDGAIWQPIPNACRGKTTENGEVPTDFLPGAIWFDSKDDFSFGVGYFTEDAFESPLSKLKFLGSTISAATRAEWNDFQSSLAENLIDPKIYTWPPDAPAKEEMKKLLEDRSALEIAFRPSFRCFGVARYSLSDPEARSILRSFQPKSRTRFWTPIVDTRNTIRKKLQTTNNGNGPLVNGIAANQYDSLGGAATAGFATRRGGGSFDSGPDKPRRFPPEVFPMRADNGVPWVSSDFATASTIYRDIEIERDSKQGFTYCYSLLAGRVLKQLELPDGNERSFVIRIDGHMLEVEQEPGVPRALIPSLFFENDEGYYRPFEINLG